MLKVGLFVLPDFQESMCMLVRWQPGDQRLEVLSQGLTGKPKKTGGGGGAAICV